jgi:4'-phosphopantetheinyl transferase EntD
MKFWSHCIERTAPLELLADQAAHCQPERWLHASEIEELAFLRSAQRRRTWQAGRWLAKLVLRSEVMSGRWQCLAPTQIAIISRDALGRGIQPKIQIDGRSCPSRLSIAHCDHFVAVAFSPQSDVEVGVDIVDIHTCSPNWIKFWFTSAEQREIHRANDPWLAPKIWAVKEATYKACNAGESFAPAKMKISRNWRGDIATCEWRRRCCHLRLIQRQPFVAAIAMGACRVDRIAA